MAQITCCAIGTPTETPEGIEQDILRRGAGPVNAVYRIRSVGAGKLRRVEVLSRRIASADEAALPVTDNVSTATRAQIDAFRKKEAQIRALAKE